MFHLKAIEIISKSLRGAVANTPEGREGMALGQYVAGMGFSNVGLGIVHSMAHPLGALYDTPHGVANAIIHLQLWNTTLQKLAKNTVKSQELWVLKVLMQ